LDSSPTSFDKEHEMSQGNILWDEHLERLGRIAEGRPSEAARVTTRSAAVSGEVQVALRGEWTARPPGRFGRRLLADVERYLDFFATARS
jgi:hypothetical protein